MERGAWWAIVYGIAKDWTQQSDLHTHILEYWEPPEEGSVLSTSGTLHMASQLNHLLPQYYLLILQVEKLRLGKLL